MSTSVSIAWITIEVEAGLAIGAGDPGSSLRGDRPVTRDANDLPCIHGSTINGALRQLARNVLPDGTRTRDEAAAPFQDHLLPRDGATITRLFGYQSRPVPGREAEGRGSRLRVGSARVHASDNVPVLGLLDPADIHSDPVLHLLSQVALRDRVRIGHQGAAEETGKYDLEIVPKGTRFSFELELEAPDDAARQDFRRLLIHLWEDGLELGGSTRSGLGRVRVERILHRDFLIDHAPDRSDLVRLRRGWLDAFVTADDHEPDGVELGALLPDFDSVNALDPSAPDLADPTPSLVLNLELVPQGFWSFGMKPKAATQTDGRRNLSREPAKAHRIVWKESGTGTTEDCLLVPFSGIKGPLLHRTLFHWCAARMGEAGGSASEPTLDEARQHVTCLFGSAKDDGSGQSGRLLGQDLFLRRKDLAEVSLHHVAIDRFTGGVLHGPFEERALWKGSLPELRIEIRHHETIEPEVRTAFAEALKDLCEGRLALGSNDGGGFGRFSGNWDQLNRDLQGWTKPKGSAPSVLRTQTYIIQ
jgi:CRISPR/Cas system CSM-associated protein Csm3 (group 7 of RAMP superfamily)